jgi:proteic killer suppression protein
MGQPTSTETQALVDDEFVPEFQGVARRAKRELEAVNAAARLTDLAVPPSNRLEKLQGAWQDFNWIRINDHWRIVFRWVNGDAHDVQVMDYH